MANLKRNSKGHPAWNKGLSWSKEMRKKLSLAHIGQVAWNKGKKYKNPNVSKANKGKHFSPTTEIKKGQHFSYKTEFKKGREGKKGKDNYFWKGGKPICEICGKEVSYQSKKCGSCASKIRFSKIGFPQSYGLARKGKPISEVERQRMKKISIMGVLKQQTMKESTSIEKKVYEELKNRGFLFETQRLINGKFVVDAYIPSLNLVIEADGDYWHSLDRVRKKDKAENAYLKKCGFGLLRLSETEIRNGLFIDKLERKIYDKKFN